MEVSKWGLILMFITGIKNRNIEKLGDFIKTHYIVNDLAYLLMFSFSRLKSRVLSSRLSSSKNPANESPPKVQFYTRRSKCRKNFDGSIMDGENFPKINFLKRESK